MRHPKPPSDIVVLEFWFVLTRSVPATTIEPDGEGSIATFAGRAECRELDPDVRRGIRNRLGTAFGAVLREWVDEPHG